MPPSCSSKAAASPLAVRVTKDFLKMRKRPAIASGRRSPVIVQIEPARIIHAQPQEFMRLVQMLTGKPSPPSDDAHRQAFLIDINVAYEGDDEDPSFSD